MGSNFYYETEPCKSCGRPFERLHIGKSSFGWNFALHIIPEMDINELDDWKRLFKKPDTRIVEDNGEVLKPEDMLKVILERKEYKPKTKDRVPNYGSREEYLASNNAQETPSGLLRYKIDNKRCVGHGEGSYDLMIGEFS